MTNDKIVDAIVDAQAELQMGIGLLKLEISRIDPDTIPGINLGTGLKRSQSSLALMHKLLEDLGHPMLAPAHRADYCDECANYAPHSPERVLCTNWKNHELLIDGK